MKNNEKDLEMGSRETEQDILNLQISPTFPLGGSQTNGAGSSEQSSYQTHQGALPKHKDLTYKPLTELNDHELALIFKEAGISGHIRYGEKGEYYHYTGCVWQRKKNKDDLWHETNRLAAFYEQAASLSLCADDREVAKKNSTNAGNIRLFSRMLSAIRTSPDLKIEAHRFDQEPYLFNVHNCTIDLSTGNNFAHRSEHLLTQISPVVFDANATCPIWEGFVAQTQDNDPDRIGHLQKAFGYSLSANNPEHALFYLVGEPQTGKSTFMEILMELLGTYANPLQQSILYRQGTDVTTKLAALHNMRVAYLPEIDYAYKIREGLLKQLTGSDRIVGRNLFANQQTLKPTWKLWIAANQYLRIETADSALFRRWQPIEFSRFHGPRDPKLPEKLKSEISGILNWAIRGFQGYQKNSLDLPARSQQIKERLRSSLDPVGSFLADRVEKCDGKRVGSTDLFKDYQTYRIQHGYDEISHKRFSESVSRKLGTQPSKYHGNQYFNGWRFRS